MKPIEWRKNVGVIATYVADTKNYTIRKVTVDGVVTTLAGLAGSPGNVDGVGSSARFNDPRQITVDGLGDVYVSDMTSTERDGYSLIRKITPDGTVSTFSTAAYNKLFTADASGNCIWRAACKSASLHPTGRSSMYASTTQIGIVAIAQGSGHTQLQPSFQTSPINVAVDGAGNIFVAFNSDVGQLLPDGSIRVIAGNSAPLGSQDGVGSAALFNSPQVH